MHRKLLEMVYGILLPIKKLLVNTTNNSSSPQLRVFTNNSISPRLGIFTNRKMAIEILLLIICSSLQSRAQTEQASFFKDGDRVCFIGNSITNNAQFYNFAWQYYATRYPTQKVRFINCGISGDVGTGVIRRMERDILIHKPTWSVVMLGMNDVGRGSYQQSRQNEAGIEDRKKKALEGYRANLETIIQTLLKAGSKIILEKPTVYEQYAKFATENYYGVNDALLLCAGYIQEMADKYKLITVDYGTLMGQINQTLRQKDSIGSIINTDRVHPGAPGHFVMAYALLKAINAPEYVSKIVIDKNEKTNSRQSLYCSISGLKIKSNSISFACTEAGLPFPISTDAEKALALVPFTEELNKEMLQVNHMKSGWYTLMIDTVNAGRFSDKELSAGINLATIRNTPQYKQSARLRDLFVTYRAKEQQIRNIQGIEIYQLPDSIKNESLEKKLEYASNAVKNFVNPVGNYGYGQLKNYLINKPEQAHIKEDMDRIFETVYQGNKPVEHVYQLIRLVE